MAQNIIKNGRNIRDIRKSDGFLNLIHKNKNFIELKIFNRHGFPIICLGEREYSDDILHGGFLSATTRLAEFLFQSEMTQLSLNNYNIFIKLSKNLIGWLVLKNEKKKKYVKEENLLEDLLEFIENECPEIEGEIHNSFKISSQIKNLLNF